jgi:GNAT superfamily N-acetyltransferase
MTSISITIRPVAPADEPRWRELFDGYTRFYEREPSDAITHHMWQRAFDPASPVYSIVAVDDRGEVIGLANYLIHENTTQLMPVCYLQDLFVDPERRRGGIGRQLIDWLLATTKREGWSRLYWHTRETNYVGRLLYDKYTSHSGFLKYSIDTTS